MSRKVAIGGMRLEYSSRIAVKNHADNRRKLGLANFITGRSIDNTCTPTLTYDNYGPYGKRVAVEGNMNVDFGYTGHYFHAPSRLNLTLYRAYNPALGRWLSRDPIGEAGGLNLYGYVHNNPLNLVDPLGLDSYWQDVSDTMCGFFNGYFDLFDWLPDDPTQEEFCIGSSIGSWTDRLLGFKGLAKSGIKAGLRSVDDIADYWRKLTKHAPEKSFPCDIIRRYDSSGNFRGATTDAAFGNRAYQYELGRRIRHGEGYHSYDNSGPFGGSGQGPRSGHTGY